MTDTDAQVPGDERSCQQCGELLAPKAAFCRSCGAKYEPLASPGQEVDAEKTEARDAEPTAVMDAARSCGECGATLAANSAFCRACGSPVESDAAVTQKLDPAPATPPPPSRPSPPPPAAGGSRSKAPFAIGALVLLLGAGVAVAIVAGKGSNASNPTTVEQVGLPGSEADYEEEPGGETVETEEEASSSGFPEVSRSQMNEEIASLLQGYHEDVVEEDFQGAWAMLSPRKRRQYLREYGYHKWATAQASLSPYLDPYGLEATVVSLEGEGVARVDVTGMGWSKPGAPCSEWSGLTWAKYEGDEWAYDPGYSTTSARRATWRPRSARLLGGNCAE
jgi:RNA polymerase subunit RPABC4/transcription elongation factor Spt4